MSIFKWLSFLVNKISGRAVFKKYTSKPGSSLPDGNSRTWKVDWVDAQGKKGTFDTQLTDLEEAEWKFNYMFDETSKIIKMYKGPVSDKDK
jgi:hypothetical protein